MIYNSENGIIYYQTVQSSILAKSSKNKNRVFKKDGEHVFRIIRRFLCSGFRFGAGVS